MWQVLHGGTNIGTAIVLNSNGQNVAVLDLKDTRIGGFGVGILVGSSQQTMNTAQSNGTWVAASTEGHWAVISVSGNKISYLSVDGVPSTLTDTLLFNSPWAGFARPLAGGHGLLAGTGVYVYEDTGGYAEMGIKIN